MTEEPIIQVENLVARYGETTILDGVSFNVHRGEIFVILGSSGCGKSTLLRHMLRLDRAYSGQVRIDRVDINRCEEDDYHRTLRKIGVLFQSSALLGSMTIAENVALPMHEYLDLPRDAIDQLVRMKLCMVFWKTM